MKKARKSLDLWQK